ncbi:hypothetical protein ACFL17_09120 [Pseudomonadota bacterium]
MIYTTCKYLFMVGLAVTVWLWNGDIQTIPEASLVATAEAVRGRPASPVSYAGVARRSTVGIGAPGPGAAPGNRGGPVNRVGRR